MKLIMVEPDTAIHIAAAADQPACGAPVTAEVREVGTEDDIEALRSIVPWCQSCDHILGVLDPVRQRINTLIEAAYGTDG